MHILVIRFSSIGDIILTEPIVRALRSRHPEGRITFLTKDIYAPLVSMIPSLDERALWNDDDAVETLQELRRMKFDLVVDLHRNWRSVRVVAAVRARTVRAEKEWSRRWAAVHLKKLRQKPSHALERYSRALADLGISFEVSAPKLILPEQSSAWWQELRHQHAISEYYVIGAGATHATKMAPNDLWGQLKVIIDEKTGWAPLFVGAISERGYLVELAQFLGLPADSVLTETDISRSAAIIKSARFSVTNDSGLSHLSAALGTPTVALFGPTHPVLGFVPLGANADHYTVDEYCSPCSRHGDRKCFRDQRYCFTKMNAEIIWQKINNLTAVS